MLIHLRAVMDVALALGGKEQILDISDGLTLEELIAFLIDKYGEGLEALLLKEREPVELLPHIKIYINGRSPGFLQGFNTVLQNEDDVMIMPQLSGG